MGTLTNLHLVGHSTCHERVSARRADGEVGVVPVKYSPLAGEPVMHDEVACEWSVMITEQMAKLALCRSNTRVASQVMHEGAACEWRLCRTRTQ